MRIGATICLCQYCHKSKVKCRRGGAHFHQCTNGPCLAAYKSLGVWDGWQKYVPAGIKKKEDPLKCKCNRCGKGWH